MRFRAVCTVCDFIGPITNEADKAMLLAGSLHERLTGHTMRPLKIYGSEVQLAPELPACEGCG